MTVELRIYVTIPGLPRPADGTPDVEAWEPFVGWLEEHAAGLGPVLAWNAQGGEVVVSGDYPDRAAAARAALDVVANGLRATGFGDLFPTAVEIVSVAADELEPA